MSIGSLGAIGSFAAAPATQRTSDASKTQQDTADQARVDAAVDYAEEAAGIGETHEESKAGDRDADGRRLWEQTDRPQQDEAPAEAATTTAKDPTGVAGNTLDLTG